MTAVARGKSGREELPGPVLSFSTRGCGEAVKVFLDHSGRERR